MGTVQRSVIWAHSNIGRQTRSNIRVKIFEAFTDSNGNIAISEYKVPVPLLGKLAEAFIVKQNKYEAETILANLKDRIES